MSAQKVKIYDRSGRRVGTGTVQDDDNFGLWVFFGCIIAGIALIVGVIWGVIYLVRGTSHAITDGQFVQSDAELQGLEPQTYVGDVTYEFGKLQNPYYSSQYSMTAFFTVPVTNDSDQPHTVALSPGVAEIRATHPSLSEPEIATVQFECGSWNGSYGIEPRSTTEFFCSAPTDYNGYQIEFLSVQQLPAITSID